MLRLMSRKRGCVAESRSLWMSVNPDLSPVHSHLQDEPGVWWYAAEIHAELQRWIAAWQPDAVCGPPSRSASSIEHG